MVKWCLWLDAQFTTGRGCGQLSSITPSRWRCNQAGHPLVKHCAYGKGYIMIGETEEKRDHKALQADQHHGQQLIEAIQLGACIGSVGQQKVLQPKQRHQNNRRSHRLAYGQRCWLCRLRMQLAHNHAQHIDQKDCKKWSLLIYIDHYRLRWILTKTGQQRECDGHREDPQVETVIDPATVIEVYIVSILKAYIKLNGNIYSRC